MLKVLWWVLFILAECWWFSDLILTVTRGRSRPAAARIVHRVLGPIYLPCVFGAVVLDALTGHIHGPLDVFTDGAWAAIAVWIWMTREKDDDDWWKRLRERAAGVVRNLGHRLTVVPEPAGA